MSCLNCNKRFYYGVKGYCESCKQEMVKNCEKEIEKNRKGKI